MKTLIINLPITGSTSLHTKLVKEQKAIGIFNPFDNTGRTKVLLKENIVVKSGVLYPDGLLFEDRVEFYKKLIPGFDKVILLSRRNNVEHLESWLHMKKHNTSSSWEENTKYGDKTKFNSQVKYSFNPNEHSEIDKEIAQGELDEWNKVLKFLSTEYNIPITYYEDIFDLSNKNRYRQKRKIELI